MREIKLNLGCGSTIIDGFINIDIREDIDERIIYDDVAVLSKFDDCSIDLIYASHVLEHFGRENILKVLACWYRKLKIGGILRLSVPDLDMVMMLCANGYYELEDMLGFIYGGKIVGYNKFLKHNIDKNIICTHEKWASCGGFLDTHQYGFNNRILSKILHAVGFSDIKKWDWRDTEHSGYDDYSQAYLPHMDKVNGVSMSLNIECVKIGD